nr:hypothetical protein [Micromonospora sp. KC207]
MGAPQQTLGHHAALGGLAEQLGDSGAARAHQLVRVAAPVGGEEVVAGTQRLHLADQPVKCAAP